MAKVLGWKIFYGDGSTYSSKQGRWEDAPSENVQIVNIYFDDGFIFRQHNFEHYSMDDLPNGGVLLKGYNLEDEEGDEFIDLKQRKRTKHGKFTAKWKEIWQTASDDNDWSRA